MSDERNPLERALGARLDPSYPVRVHTYAVPGLDYEVLYAAVQLPPDAVQALQDAARLTSPEAQAYTRVMLPSGWRVDPGDPPEWWPTDPESLTEQAARAADPGGWLVSGHRDGTLFVLATRAGAPS